MKRSTLEWVKFSVYLVAPIIAVYVYSFPIVHETHMKSARYVVHPATPTTEELILARQSQRRSSSPPPVIT